MAWLLHLLGGERYMHARTILTDKTTADLRAAWITGEQMASLEPASEPEPTRELQVFTRHTSGFFQSETEPEDLEDGTVEVDVARSRLRLDLAPLTGPSGPLPIVKPAEQETGDELTGVKPYARTSRHVEPPTKLMRRPPQRRERTPARPPATEALVLRPLPIGAHLRSPTPPPAQGRRSPRTTRPSASHDAPPRNRPSAVVGRGSPPVALPPRRIRGRRRNPVQAAATSISRICWNVVCPAPEPASPRDERPRSSWRHHKKALAGSAALLWTAALLLLLLLPGAKPVGLMEVVSAPPGARVTVNGTAIDQTTPVLLKVPNMNREQVVEVSLADYRGWRKVVKLSADEPRIQVLAVLELAEQDDDAPASESYMVEPLAAR